MDMLFFRTFISTVVIIIIIIITVHFKPCFCDCGGAEYEINGECCPMCAPGNRVYRHCTVDTSTTCVPCLALTYTDEPNGLMKCFSCSVCDAGKGLKVQKACTRSEDTICEPREGFYCINPKKGSCEIAVTHTTCKSGQYIKQTGTAFTDTVCADCTDGTYSNGSLMACLPHLKCETMGLKELKAGTTSSDAECDEQISVGLVAGVTVAGLLAVTVTLLACIMYKKRKARHTVKRVCKSPREATEDDETATQFPLDANS